MNIIHSGPSLGAITALLESAQLPTADLTPHHCKHFFYYGPESSPAGLIGLELLGDVALLRSLAVIPQARSTGLGSALVAHAENYARSNDVRALYLLTTTAERFFLRLGYTPAARDSAPPAIRATREFAGICPASSAFLTKQL